MDRRVTSFLSAVGKPFYKLLTFTIIIILFFLSAVGKIFQLTWEFITVKSNKFVKLFLLRIQLKAIGKKRKVKTRKKIVSKLIVSKKLHVPKRPKIKFPKKLFFLLITFGMVIFSLFFYILRDLPSPRELVTREQPISTKIYDRSHVLLFTIYKDQNRTPVSLNEIPTHVRLATLAAEDAEFYNHPGFSVRGILRAMIKNIREGKLNGGSTITQQLVKNALLSPEKTLIRKIREIVLSVAVELTYSKDEILEMYLNEVSYGGTAYGIEEASRVYFGKDVKSLTIGEAALLAGLPQSPTKLSPFGSDPELAKSRQEEVLHLMKINKFITEQQEEDAKNEKLKFAENKTQILAPHFVMYVRRMLEEKYGVEVVEKGGLEVTTTLDLQIQKLAEEVVSQEVDKLTGLNVTNSAAVVLNPKTGEILAMVGSKDYFDTAADGNVNVATRLRQPGSSIKLINYAYALSHDFTAASILYDAPVAFTITGQPTYTPRNYDNKFRGYISLRSAFAESRNIPAVKVLATYGVDKMVDMGTKMGITTWTDPANYGLSLTLGGGEVKLIDLADAYATVANHGVKPEITSITRVTNYQGKTLEDDGESGTEVLDPRVAFILTDILKDNVARTPAFGSRSALVIQNHPEIAVKTGTSNDLRDNLTVGFNQDYLTAVWVGNNNNTPMARVASGVTGASPIWNKIMTALLAQEESKEWEIPGGLVQKKNCFGQMEWFLAENQEIDCSQLILPEAASTQKNTN